jgi:hypothetical protein
MQAEPYARTKIKCALPAGVRVENLTLELCGKIVIGLQRLEQCFCIFLGSESPHERSITLVIGSLIRNVLLCLCYFILCAGFPIYVVIAGDRKDVRWPTAANLRNPQEPSFCGCVLIWIRLEGDVTTHENGIDPHAIFLAQPSEVVFESASEWLRAV